MLVLFQVVTISLVLIIAFLRPQLGYKLSRPVWRWVGVIARKRSLSLALVGLTGLLGSAAVSLLIQIPHPYNHDEFGYLLAADTFVRGRVTNPTHPMWVHFESFHIIHQPTYASKYPPGQGLILAIGQFIGGHPIVGVWISIGFMSGAICWMLQAWLPPRWALLGGLLVTLHPEILTKWGQGYMGGAVAATGGALVFGALRRIMLRPHVCHALVMGLGLAILANSRPFEGLVASVPVAVMLVLWMFSKNGPSVGVSIGRVVLPILALLIPTGVAMGFYNLGVTGNATRMPYLVHEAAYGIAPLFLWQSPRPAPNYRHQIMRDYHTVVLDSYMQTRSVLKFIKKNVTRIKRLWKFYLGLVLTVPLIVLPWALRDQWMRFGLLTCGLLVAVFLLYTWVQPHYAAPITGLVFAMVLRSMRHLGVWRWHSKQTGQFIVRSIPVICIVWLVLSLPEKTHGKPEYEWSLQRARILAQLQGYEGRHLAIVRYEPTYARLQMSMGYGEWVYNEAEIDGAKVVWAREMDATQNRKLLEYFRDRQFWLLEVNGDQSPLKLLPYPAGSAP